MRFFLVENNKRNLGGRPDSSVGIATGYGLDDRGFGFPVPVGSRIFLHVVQTGSEAHTVSHLMGIGDSIPGGKAA
jgi:hypothetical protein